MNVQVLLADDDAGMRSLVAASARTAAEEIVVLEAADGAEAVRLGLQQRPQIALLDIGMPRLDGIDVAITLRELQPELRLALLTADPHPYRDRARERGLPLFDKLDIDRALGWVALQVKSFVEAREALGKSSLECAWCGYGIHCSSAPERCPMCHALDSWVSSRRPAGTEWSSPLPSAEGSGEPRCATAGSSSGSAS